jgi:rhamnogalacturonyl hydrolase YesR
MTAGIAAMLLLSTTMVADPATAPVGQAAVPSRRFDAAIDRAAIRRVTDSVAAWQFSHLRDLSYISRNRADAEDTRGWVQGALYIGAFHWARASGSTALMDRIEHWAAANEYRLGDRLYHADDHAVGRTYLALRSAGLVDQRALVGVRAYFDAILADPSTASLQFDHAPSPQPPTDRWSWCDALFMSPPAWFELSALTGDPRYRDFADREFWATTDYLFDKQAGFYYRDSRFFDRRGPNGEKLFWGRGNGWAIAGLVAILESMPSDYPQRPRYEALFKHLAASLKAAQRPGGYWSSSLLATNPHPEMSGTAFFVYALQRGIDMGLLSAADYGPVVRRGWSSLVDAVQPDGRLTYVQQIGDSPESVRPEDSELYGPGAFMLAASAVYGSASETTGKESDRSRDRR